MKSSIRSTQTLCACALLLALALSWLQPFFPVPKIPGKRERLEKMFGIPVIADHPEFPVKAPYGRIDGSAAPQKSNQDYLEYFAPEFSLYPPSLIQNTKLKRIIFCRDLVFAGQKRNAFPDYHNDTLYYDTVDGASNQTYKRKVIHHEFFHIIDLRDDGVLFGDDVWKTLNRKDFLYGLGGARAQTLAGTATLTDRYPGFLNHYSTTGVEEDKAELFANLIVDADYVEKRAKTDPVLRAKIERLKRLMILFCPEMDESFWIRARKLKR